MAAVRQGVRRPRPVAEPEERGNPLLPLLMILGLLALVGAAGFGVYVVLHMDRFFPKQAEVEEDDGPRPLAKPEKPVEAPPAPVVEEKPVVEEAPEPPPPPKKTVAEMKAEAEEAQRELAAKIAEARKDGHKPIPGFGGVRFGEPLEGLPVLREEQPGGGTAYAVLGPALKKPLFAFSARPLVWVTPKTRKVFRIEYACDLAKPAGEALSPETTNVVAAITAKFNRTPFSLDVEKYPLAPRTFVYVFGDTSLTLGEYGGTRLKLVIEHEGYGETIRKESEAVRQETLAEKANAAVLGSSKYPNGGKVKSRVRTKSSSPGSFCGVVFGTLPPSGARLAPQRLGVGGFYLDYRFAKCAPFFGFDHGKATVGSAGVSAVELFSDGSSEGLTDDEYAARVRAALAKHFKAKAQPAAASSKDEVTVVGDVTITFGPDPRGGFRLKAEHAKYAAF